MKVRVYCDKNGSWHIGFHDGFGCIMSRITGPNVSRERLWFEIGAAVEVMGNSEMFEDVVIEEGEE